MTGSFDFTGQDIETTYQRVLQTDGINIYDGTGSLITNFPSFSTGSYTGSFEGEFTGSFTGSFFGDFNGTSSYALTASYQNPLFQDVLLTGSLLTTGSNLFVGKQDVIGEVEVLGSVTASYFVGTIDGGTF
jgi:hypothetical protein